MLRIAIQIRISALDEVIRSPGAFRHSETRPWQLGLVQYIRESGGNKFALIMFWGGARPRPPLPFTEGGCAPPHPPNIGLPPYLHLAQKEGLRHRGLWNGGMWQEWGLDM